MVDIASRYNRSVFGINVAFMKNHDIVTRTIGMHALHMAHTGKNLRDMIVQNLDSFKIPLENVLSVTSDNGENMLKAIALLDAQYQQQKDLCEFEFRNSNDRETNGFSDESIDDEILDGAFYSELLNSVRNEFKDTCYTDLIYGVSCACHGIHLIVTKSIAKSKEALALIVKCRQLAKKLRSQTFRYILERKNQKNAKIDVETRWNSVYTMVIISFFSKTIILIRK